MRVKSQPLIAACILIGAALLLLPLPKSGRTFQALTNLAHVPLGAGLALVLRAALRRRWEAPPWRLALAAFAAATGVLALTEVVQPLVGRSGGWGDLVRGVSGAGGAILLHAAAASSRPLRRAMLAIGGVVALALPCMGPARLVSDALRQRHEMPMLASFEDELELTRWTFEDADASRRPLRATAGDYSLQLSMRPGLYPGATLAWPPPDWVGYRALVLDLHLEGREPLALETKITDRRHNGTYGDRFNRTVRLEPGSNQVRIRLDEVADAPKTRRLDLSRVALLQLFVHKLVKPRVLHIDNVHLEVGP